MRNVYLDHRSSTEFHMKRFVP